MRKIAAFLFIPISAWKALLAWHFFFLTVQTVQSQMVLYGQNINFDIKIF